MSPQQYRKVMGAVRKLGMAAFGTWGFNYVNAMTIWGHCQCPLGCVARAEGISAEDVAKQPSEVLARLLGATPPQVRAFVDGVDGNNIKFPKNSPRERWYRAGKRMIKQIAKEGLLRDA